MRHEQSAATSNQATGCSPLLGPETHVVASVSPRKGAVGVQVKRIIRKRIRRVGNGIDLAADVNADVQVNVGSRRSTSAPASRPPSAGAPSKRPGKENR